MKEYKYSKRAAAAAMAGLLAVSLAVPTFAAEDVDTAAEAEVEAVMTEDGAMTRGEMLLAMYRALGGEPVEGAEAFTDIDADSELAAAASWGVAEKIVSGYGDGSFGAEDPVTREQAATMLYRYAAAQGKGFQGAWMFLLNYPDADEISEYADEAMHWMVMNEILPDAETRLAPKGNLTRAGLREMLERFVAALGHREEASEEAPAVETVELANKGLRFPVPVDMADLLVSETPEDGALFSFSEKASVDAAKEKGEEDFGAGWLFDIGFIDEAKLHELLCADMSGVNVFATDGKGTYFVQYHPTDVRIDRVGELTDEDTAQWTAAHEWIAGALEQFVKDNDLKACRFGNTDLDISLYRLAYQDGVPYSLAFLTHGELNPEGAEVDRTPYLEQLLNGATFTYSDKDDDDGEYYVLNLPEEELRIDFLTRSDVNYIRINHGEDATLYEASYPGNLETVPSQVMADWYTALYEAQQEA